jgi:glycosyltransferase involved in cell wall biosynthesis
VDGTVCAPFDVQSWADALSRILADPDPRIKGRDRAEQYSAVAMAGRLANAWRAVL